MSSRRDREHDLSRRALIRWSLAAGAALGVSRSRIFDVLERAGGTGVAQAASTITTKRSVHIRAGDGGFAWFQLLWPHNAIAAVRNDVVSWHAPGEERLVDGTYHPLTRGPDTPFELLPPERQVTAIMAGENETHNRNPTSIVRALNGSSMFAIAGALQATNPCAIPVITMAGVSYGSALGAPTPAVVQNAAGFVGLFDSAASRDGGLLASGTDNAEIYRASQAALAGLNRAADRSTTQRAYATGRSAATFVGVNLAAQLRPSAEDRLRYGLDRPGVVVPDDVAELASTLMIAVKAFKLGLTQSVIVPGPQDDPHPAFDNLDTLRQKVAALRLVLDGFMEDLTLTTDDHTGRRLVEDIVITIEGDTPKTPLNRAGWGDETPDKSNWIYVYSGGVLRTGWFGGIAADGAVTGFDPLTGAPAPTDRAAQAAAAVSAIAYAIANGSDTRVKDFSRSEYRGLIGR
jgi:hypothetical protein